MDDNIPLTCLLSHLHEAGYKDLPDYRACYEAARSAKIPAQRGANGRWKVDPNQVGEIAKRLGLGWSKR